MNHQCELWRERLWTIPTETLHGRLAVAAVEAAIIAVESGNPGFGAVIADQQGGILATGGNATRTPKRRTDLHAEMVALNAWEDQGSPGECLMVSSIEPCPMCITRGLASSIGDILYVATDKATGMSERLLELPKFWTAKAAGRHIGLVDCPDELRDLSRRIMAESMKKGGS